MQSRCDVHVTYNNDFQECLPAIRQEYPTKECSVLYLLCKKFYASNLPVVFWAFFKMVDAG
jgi:hypothetical protein